MTSKRTDGRGARRVYAFIVSLVVSAIAVLGAYSSASALELGLAKSKPAAVPALAARARKLDAYEQSLRRSLASKPPALPDVPRYPAVAIPVVPTLSSLVQSQESNEATESSATRRRVKVTYVRPAPIVQVVQAANKPQTTGSPGDDDVEDDAEGHEDHPDDDGATDSPTP